MNSTIKVPENTVIVRVGEKIHGGVMFDTKRAARQFSISFEEFKGIAEAVIKSEADGLRRTVFVSALDPYIDEAAKGEEGK